MNPQQLRLLSDSIAQGTLMFSTLALVVEPVEFGKLLTFHHREED
jgi:hypothetical protein